MNCVYLKKKNFVDKNYLFFYKQIFTIHFKISLLLKLFPLFILGKPSIPILPPKPVYLSFSQLGEIGQKAFFFPNLASPLLFVSSILPLKASFLSVKYKILLSHNTVPFLFCVKPSLYLLHCYYTTIQLHQNY